MMDTCARVLHPAVVHVLPPCVKCRRTRPLIPPKVTRLPSTRATTAALPRVLPMHRRTLHAVELRVPVKHVVALRVVAPPVRQKPTVRVPVVLRHVLVLLTSEPHALLQLAVVTLVA